MESESEQDSYRAHEVFGVRMSHDLSPPFIGTQSFPPSLPSLRHSTMVSHLELFDALNGAISTKPKRKSRLASYFEAHLEFQSPYQSPSPSPEPLFSVSSALFSSDQAPSTSPRRRKFTLVGSEKVVVPISKLCLTTCTHMRLLGTARRRQRHSKQPLPSSGDTSRELLESVPPHRNTISTYRIPGHLHGYKKGRYCLRRTQARLKTAAGEKVYSKQ